MSWTLKISEQARQDLDYFRAYLPDVYRTCLRLSKAVEISPFEGIGRPINIAPLGANVWSRNVSLEHRMVYEVFADTVLVAAYRKHID